MSRGPRLSHGAYRLSRRMTSIESRSVHDLTSTPNNRMIMCVQFPIFVFLHVMLKCSASSAARILTVSVFVIRKDAEAPIVGQSISIRSFHERLLFDTEAAARFYEKKGAKAK